MFADCESDNLIYIVICQGCKEEYIEGTGSLVKKQIDNYRTQKKQTWH